jgi:DNA (cytosine-5)-methyltransferase 1
MTFLELFAGIGGFRLGLERHGHKCLYTNEWLQKPASIYEKNFGEKPDTRDIRTIRPEELPDADLICGGFPCATFSIAGKREGIYGADTRGTLFFEICRIAAVKRTKYIFLENVKGLLNHANGKTFAVILISLDRLGYDVQWELLNSRNFGVPQNRERIFIVANLRGTPRPKVFPIGICGREEAIQNREEQESRERLQATYNQGKKRDEVCNGFHAGFAYGQGESDCVGTIDANFWKGGRTHVEENGKSVHAILTPRREEKRQNGRLYKDHNEPSFTLGVQDIHGVMITEKGKTNIRNLTPLELERLQGLPDNFTKYYADGSLVSDKERYERCGRTVTIPVIEEIAKRLNTFY